MGNSKKMKTFFLSILFFFVYIAFAVASQIDSINKTRLKELVQERKDKFESYTDAVDKRSGIFGIQTKKDLKATNEVLTEIVRTDNQIMRELNRMLSYKTYEKVNMNYSLMESTTKTEKFLKAIETLNARVEKLEVDKKTLAKRNDKYKFLAYLFAGLSLILLVGLIISRRRKRSIN